MKNTVWQLLAETQPYERSALPDVHPVVAQLLWNRGMRTPAQAEQFLTPSYERDVHDPFLFHHMRRVVDRLRAAIAAHELIIVHGDYDADGICAAALLTHTLRTLGAHVDAFIPHRELDGYGLRAETVEALAGRGAKIIITCDCGISNAPEIALARSRGVEVIVTDHHTIPAVLPDAFAILHPKIAGETYPDQTLSGGGVAFKLMQGLMQDAETQKLLPPDVNPDTFQKWQLDLVAISSVADMVPLVGETRTLVYYGCKVLGKTRRPGLRALLTRDRITITDAGPSQQITPQTIAFKIAPRINAAGRMDHGRHAFDMLLATDAADGTRLAEALHQYNTDRQKLTETIVKEAITKIMHDGLDTRAALVVSGDGWPAGLVGLIASRLKEKYYKPTFVIGVNKGRIVGSGRSVDEWDMIAALQSRPELFVKFGGHPQACGFSLADETAIGAFASAMHEIASAQVQKIHELVPTVAIDAAVNIDELDWPLLHELQKLEPFGVGNPEPIFVSHALHIVGAQSVGADGKHLRLTVQNGSAQIKKMMAFGMGEFLPHFAPGAAIHGAYRFGVNEWNGMQELQYTLQDFRLA